MTTYYVSSIIGSDDNAGTSGSAPLASLQAAENLVKPGDTVEVMNGTYTGPGGGNVLTISTSGTASAPITFEAAPGATPVIDSSGTWQAIELDASYITIKGLTIVGDAANYNLSSAMAGYSTGNPDLNGNAIAATSGKLIHHIIIENNTIYNEPGAGIGINNGDYLQILNNNVHDNAHWSAYGASGISIGASQNFDNGPGPHIIIRGNTSVNNAELVPEYRANAITDGEGIILDSNSGYTGGFLVQNNTTHGNSGPGIESFHSDNAVITGNTATGDLTNPNLVSEGEIFINQSNNNTVSNNITTAAPPPPPSGQLITNGSFETHDFGGWTLGGNSGPSTFGPQFFIDTTPVNGTYAAGLGSMGSDGTLSQTIATTAGKTYTLSFWLQNEAPGANDFKATWNGQTLVSLTNAAQSGYKQYTYSVTATGSASTLQFSARNDPKQWDLDNVSLTASGTPTPPATTPTITGISESPATGHLNAGKTVALTLDFSENVTVAGGRPTLSLNDRGTATYVKGSGTKTLTFNYTVAAGQNIASLAATAVGLPSGVTIKDSAGNAANLSLVGRTQSGPQIDTTTPTVTSLIASPATGHLNAGKTVALTLDFSENVTVAGGRPTLSLNDRGTATYVKGSGTKTLTFNYTVAAGQNIASLAATAVGLPSGVTIKDSAGNAANLSLVGRTQSGPQIDTTTPTVTSLIASPATGHLNAGKTVALTLDFSENVTVAGGRPTLSLNDRGTATYAKGSGTKTLTFNYTVAAGQNIASLAATAVGLPSGVTIKDSAGNAANLSLVGRTQSGPQIDTTTPTITGISESPATGHLNAGKTVALTLDFSENVTVAGGRPTLSLNDRGTATYAKGSGTKTLTFNYTVAAGQNIASLAATAVGLPSGVTIKDSAGNAANLSLVGRTQSGPQIDTTTPTVTSLIASPATGHLNAGKTVALTLDFSENVTVAGGRPTLSLNDRGTATYAKGSGTKTLTFNYTVAAGQNIASLAATAVGLPSGVTIKDSAGNAANLSLVGRTQSGPQIDTTTPTITGISESPATGHLNAGKTVALTLDFSENVTVAGGRPTLSLNDRGTATYAKGSGTKTLTFNYTVAAGQNIASLAATAVGLPSGVTIKDSAGNAANLSLVGRTQSGPQIDTTTPTITGISESPATGHLNAGKTVALTLDFSENVTVAGGRPTLSLNDRGTATYAKGSGTKTLTFNYTVAAGQNIASLAATAVGLPSGVTIKDSAGNAANLSLVGRTQSGPQIDTTTPTITGISESPATGHLNAGKTVALTLDFSENVTVAGGRPTLSLNDRGTATYAKGSGTKTLTFNYTVAAGQNIASLAATAVGLPSGVTIKDSAGNAANLSLVGRTQSGPQIDTTTPTITGISESPATGHLNAGKTVALTLDFSENVTVAGGRPTLSLNDRGTATYVKGSGTKTLTFNYTVAAGQNIASLAATAVGLPSGVTIKDSAGNAANLSLVGRTQSGPQIDTTTPTVTSLVTSPATGTQFPGDPITIAAKMSEAVTVTGGAPTLTLNDGGSAKYSGGSGTNTLTFKYTVGSSDRDVSALAISAVNLPSGVTIKDSAGNTANMAGAIISFPALAVDPPVVITQNKADGSYDVAHFDVTGLSHTSYEDLYNSAETQVAEARDMSGGAGALILDANHLSVSSSSGSLGVTTGSDRFNVNSHTSESIVASGWNAETFEYGSGFGQESISGLLVSGPSNDVVEFPVAMFKGLSSTNTAIQNWDALVSSGAAVQSGANVTITDAAHDILTLNNMTTSTLSHYTGNVFKFV